jgi:23S rRNA (adenine2503-C2)-methyltransferase
MTKLPLLGLTLDQLKELVATEGLPAFAANQIAGWLYKKRVKRIEDMTNLSVANRQRIAERYDVGCSDPVKSQLSADGTRKYLFQTSGQKFVETVSIPEDDRQTLCLSSQAGCKMNCRFCMTGKQGFAGNLTAAEMLNQIHAVPESQHLTNVVFMGMGEPLDNIDETLKALEILTAGYGYAWSPKRITVSTVGIASQLQQLLEGSRCHLAVSLHSPLSDERQELMPIEKAYPIRETLEVIRKYDFAHQRRVSFEYILFDGLNDDPYHARELATLLAGIPCRVNLIRYHVIPGVDLHPSNAQKMIAFRDRLSARGIVCTIRASRGEDIRAACGMLSTENDIDK